MISTRTRAILSLVGVFLLGAIAGGGALGLYLKGQISDSQSMNDPKSFSGFVEERLRLSEAQRDSLRDELGATYEDMAALRNATAEEYSELIDTLTHRVAPLLDPEQRKLLERLEQRMRKRLSRGVVRSALRPGIVDSVGDETSVPAPQSPPRVAMRDSAPKGSTPERPPLTSIPTPRAPVTPLPNRPDASAGDSAAREMPIEDEDQPMSGNRFLPDVDTLRTRLGLSVEQLRSVRQIIRATREKTRTDLAGLRGFRRLQKEALRRNLREMDTQIEALLNDQQRVEYRAHRELINQRLRENRRREKPLIR